MTLLALFLHPLHLQRKRGEKLAQKRKKITLCDADGIPKEDKKDEVSDRGVAFSLGSVGAVTVEMKCVIPEQGINEPRACKGAADTGALCIQSPPVFG